MAQRAIGSLSRIIMGEETTWGVAPSPFNGVVLSSMTYGESLRGTKEENLSDVITGDRSRRASIPGNLSAAGSFPFNVSIDGFPTLIKHALGTVTTTGSGPYTHTIKRGQLPPGMHIEKQFLNLATPEYIVYPGTKIGTLNWTLASEGLINGTADVMAKTQTAMTVTSLDSNPTEPKHTPLHHKAATTSEGGLMTDIVGFEMAIANNLDEGDYVIGDDTKQSLDEGMGDVTGTATFRFVDSTQYDKWFNDTVSSLNVVMNWGGGLGITIDMPNIIYNGEVGPALETAQGIVIAMPYRALYDQVIDSDVEITVVNNDATI